MRRPIIFYALANTGVYAWVPPLAVGVLAPLGYVGVRSSGSLQATAVYLGLATGLIIPLLAAWWPVFVFKERIEGDGRELLYFLRPRGESIAAVLLIALYCLLLIPLGVIAHGDPAFELAGFAITVSRSVLIGAFAFWATFVTKSSPLALVAVLAFQMVGLGPLESVVAAASSTMIGPQRANAIVMAVSLLLAAAAIIHGGLRSRIFSD